jgi:signal peptidase I
VVIFRLPRDNATDYIKRVIGLPGDKVLRAAIVCVNGSYRKRLRASTPQSKGLRPMPHLFGTLPKGARHYVLVWRRQAERGNVAPFVRQRVTASWVTIGAT